jgi:cyanate permease
MKKIIKNIIISAMFYSAGFMLASIGPYVIGDAPTVREAAGSIPAVVVYDALLHIAWFSLFIAGGFFACRVFSLMADRAIKHDK